MSAAAVALLTASATAAAAGTAPARPEVALFATRPASGDAVGVRADFREAFSRALSAAARRGFAERRWRVRGVAAAEGAASALDSGCAEASCLVPAAVALEVDRFVDSRLEVGPQGSCLALARLVDLRGQIITRRAAAVLPCELDELLIRAEALGRAVSRGPRWSPAAPAPMSGTPLPDLHVRAIPDVPPPELTVTTTVTRPFPLDQALAQYQRKAVRPFYDAEGRLRFARDGRLLDECDLRRAASAPLTREQRVFCRGNGWIWSLVGVPAGGLLAAASFPELEQGNLQGFFGVGLGLISAATSAALAIGLSEFGHGPEEGVYLTDPEGLRRIAEASNRQLRAELGLTAREVALTPPVAAPGR